jgi:hypothetical protein
MDQFQALANSQLAMSLLLNSAASDALTISRLGQPVPSTVGALSDAYSTNMLRLQRELLNREIASREIASRRAAALSGAGTGPAADVPLYLRMLSAQHPPAASFLTSARPLSAALTAASPSLKPGAGATVAASDPLKRRHRESFGEDSMTSSSSAASMAGSEGRKKQRFAAAAASPASFPRPEATEAVAPSARTGARSKIRDDFWGKVGKTGSHIHLVNIVLGRLLYDHVRSVKGGNKVLSNDFIQSILNHKLYGKYAVKDFFASANKASETVRNTWTRLNFASDNIRQGLSRYKEQTWQAIERCGFEDISEEDSKEMEDALQLFVKTGRFVPAQSVALKGIITEQFMGVLMQLRREWNSICLNCPPEDHDQVVASFLRCYGLNGK